MAFFGLFSKEKKETLNKGLEKTKQSFFSKIARTIVGKSTVDDEVLDNGVPDLRGTWKVAELLVNGVAAPADHHLWAHVERIEQSGNRVIVVGGGVIHDFASCDGTLENGLHDVMAIDFSTPLQVAATFDDGVLVMRPQGMPVEVKRWRDGEQLVWEYSIAFTARLHRIA